MRTKHLPIADPCHEDWDAMDQVSRGRFCQSCVKQVYDLSSMTENQARSLLTEKQGSRICVRYVHDESGRIRFRAPTPCTPAPTPCASAPEPATTTCAPPRRMAWVGAAMMAAAMAACTPHEHPDHRPAVEPAGLESMGKIAVEPDPEIEHVVMGEMPIDPQPVEVKGEIEAIDPPTPPPQPELEPLMGDVMAEPIIETKGGLRAEPPPPEPMPEPIEVKGDVAVPEPAPELTPRMGQAVRVDPIDVPCDG